MGGPGPIDSVYRACQRMNLIVSALVLHAYTQGTTQSRAQQASLGAERVDTRKRGHAGGRETPLVW